MNLGAKTIQTMKFKAHDSKVPAQPRWRFLKKLKVESQYSSVGLSAMSDSVRHHGLWPARLLCPWDSSGQNTGVGSCSFLQEFSSPGDFPNPGVESRSLELLGDSLLSEPPGKPKNTGVGSLTLLQGIFLTQEWKWSLLHCRWIFLLAELPGNPKMLYDITYTWHL